MDSGYNLTNENPLKNATIFSKIFFSWMIKFCYKCIKNGICMKDLYKLMECDDSAILGDKLAKEWQDQLLVTKRGKKKPSLLKAVTTTFGSCFIKQGLLLFVQFCVFRTLRPFIIFKLLHEFENFNGNLTETLYTIGYLLLVSFIIILLYHNINNELILIGMRARIAISSLINRKLLRLNKIVFGQTTTGQITNLISNDVQRLHMSSRAMHFIWITPLQFVITIVAVWYKLGLYSAISIGLSILILTPFFFYCGKMAKVYRARVAVLTDSRLKYFIEVIDGILVIKLNVWEDIFKANMAKIRDDEIKTLKFANRIRALIFSAILSVERILLCVGVVAYAYTYHAISADVVFYFAQFCHICHLSITLYLILGIFETSECLTTINRVEHFLLLDERNVFVDVVSESEMISMQNIIYQKNTKTNGRITLNIQPGTFCAVIGPVGSGKSTLLHMLMNEVNILSGTIKVGGKISYASQQTWLFPASVKNNIIFSDNYNEDLYKKIVNVCDLANDLEYLLNNDDIVIGEKAISLSGGQRSRINLARAVYRKADIYLLDDPLSSVDSKTVKNIMEKCFLDYLKDKTRILVTHNVQLLKDVDLIIMMENGEILAKGSFEDLRCNAIFKKFVADNQGKLKEDVSGKDDPFVIDKSLDIAKRRAENVRDNNYKIPGRNIGKILMNAIKFYLFAGHWCKILGLLLFHVFVNLTVLSIDILLVIWIDVEMGKKMVTLELIESNNSKNYEYEIDDNKRLDFKQAIYNNIIYVYISLVLFLIFITISFTFTFFKVSEKASRNLHRKAFNAIVNGKIDFYKTNETGELFNRFSKDLGCADECLPKTIALTLQGIICALTTISLIAYYNVYIASICTILLINFLFFQKYLIIVMQNLKQLETATKTPLFTHINSTINGLITIRCFEREEILRKEFDHHQNVNTSACHSLIHSSSVFGLWLDISLLSILALICFTTIYLKDYLSIRSSTLGLIIIRSLPLIGMLQNSMKECADMICYLISLQRIQEYTNVEKEVTGNCDDIRCQNLLADKELLKTWPNKGEIIFKDVNFKYNDNETYLLKNINLRINGGDKVGIVGRTGIGKTSLIKLLLKLYPVQGKIYIDGFDINDIDLYSFRKQISVIPQNPILFTGTIRFNLDPLRKYRESAIWRALEKVHLLELIKSLDMKIEADTNIFSSGQKQLLCIARALIETNKILILDEATANVDPQTDSLIQETINREFVTCTVISIAHRIHSIIKFDKIIVLNDGMVVEYDHPNILLNNVNGHFYQLVKEMGINILNELTNLSHRAYKIKYDNL